MMTVRMTVSRISRRRACAEAEGVAMAPPVVGAISRGVVSTETTVSEVGGVSAIAGGALGESVGVIEEKDKVSS